MSDRDAKLRQAQHMARDVIRNSIVEDALARFLAQVLEVAHENKRKELTRLRAENARLREALETCKTQAEATPLHPFCAMVIETARAALAQKEGE